MHMRTQRAGPRVRERRRPLPLARAQAVSCYEYFYATVPPHMRSVCQSVNLLCTAFGSLAAAGLNAACAAWVPNNLDEGHLEYVFFLLAGAMAVDMGVFVLAATFLIRDPFIGTSPSKPLSAATGTSTSAAEYVDGMARLFDTTISSSRTKQLAVSAASLLLLLREKTSVAPLPPLRSADSHASTAAGSPLCGVAGSSYAT